MSAHFDSSHYASTHYESSHYNRGLVAVITPGGGLDEDTLWRIRRLKKRQRNVANAVALLTMLVSVIEEERDYNAEEPDE
jgi:Na+/alanine symporter